MGRRLVEDLGEAALFEEVKDMAHLARLKRLAELVSQVMVIAPLATYSCIRELARNVEWEKRTKELEAEAKLRKRQIADLTRKLAEAERDLREEVEQRVEHTETLRAQCANARRKIDSLNRDMRLKNTEVSSLPEELSDVKEELRSATNTSQDMAVEVERLTAELAHFRGKYEQLAAAYDPTIHARVNDTLRAFWYLFPDLDFTKVSPNYGLWWPSVKGRKPLRRRPCLKAKKRRRYPPQYWRRWRPLSKICLPYRTSLRCRLHRLWGPLR